MSECVSARVSVNEDGAGVKGKARVVLEATAKEMETESGHVSPDVV